MSMMSSAYTSIRIPRNEIVKIEEQENAAPATLLSMKDCVSKFSETSVGASSITVSAIQQLWEKAVGKDISTHVHVRHVRNRILHVTSDHFAWKTQLKFMESEIIKSLNTALGGEKIISISMSIK